MHTESVLGVGHHSKNCCNGNSKIYQERVTTLKALPFISLSITDILATGSLKGQTTCM